MIILANPTRRINALIVFNTILYSSVIFLTLIVGLFIVYVMVCWFDSQRPPARFNVLVSPLVEAGGKLRIDVTDIYRWKLCLFKRKITILDSSHAAYSYEQDVNVPIRLGHDGPLNFSLTLDPDIAKGPATFTLDVLYNCPHNLLQAQWPYVITKQASFRVQ